MGAGDFIFNYVVGGVLLTILIYFCRYFHNTRLLGNTICFFGLLIVIGLVVGEFYALEYEINTTLKVIIPRLLKIEFFYPLTYLFFTIGVFYYSIREQILSRKKTSKGD